jgi:hypothetical protein
MTGLCCFVCLLVHLHMHLLFSICDFSVEYFTKRGWLSVEDRGTFRTVWRRRYFVLRAHTLFCFESEAVLMLPSSKTAIAEYPLRGAAVVLVSPPKCDRHHTIELCMPTMSLLLSADSKDEIRVCSSPLRSTPSLLLWIVDDMCFDSQEWAMVLQRNSIVASGAELCSSHCSRPDFSLSKASVLAGSTSFRQPDAESVLSIATASMPAPTASTPLLSESRKNPEYSNEVVSIRDLKAARLRQAAGKS